MSVETRAKELLNRTTPMAMAIATNSLRIDENDGRDLRDYVLSLEKVADILERLEALETLLGVTYTEGT